MAKKTARNKLMDYLARRDHSEKELYTKLIRTFSEEETRSAIEYAKSHGWLPNDESSLQTLSEKVANELHKKNKGILYINNYLQQKGLPTIQNNKDLELQKALNLAKSKKDKAKAGRLLQARGFELDIVRKVIYESF